MNKLEYDKLQHELLLREFESLVNEHDLTFEFSDDHRVWTNGTNELGRIKALASKLDKQDTVRIWNNNVEKKIVQSEWKTLLVSMNQKFLKIARRAADKSNHTRYKVACIVFKGSKILSIGYNKAQTHTRSPHKFKSIHAEFHALNGLTTKQTRNASVFVYMQRRCGCIGLSKPCESCESLLRDYGIKHVYYTLNESMVGYYELT